MRSLNPLAPGRKLRSIVLHRCPACQKGKLFLNPNPYNLKTLDKMPAKCEVCGEDFKREPGFYYGSMMISHGLTTIMAVIIHFTVFHFYGWNITMHLVFLLSFIIGLFPFVFRTARAIWINIFVRYKNP